MEQNDRTRERMRNQDEEDTRREKTDHDVPVSERELPPNVIRGDAVGHQPRIRIEDDERGQSKR